MQDFDRQGPQTFASVVSANPSIPLFPIGAVSASFGQIGAPFDSTVVYHGGSIALVSLDLDERVVKESSLIQDLSEVNRCPTWRPP